jgi:hypothetical protein
MWRPLVSLCLLMALPAASRASDSGLRPRLIFVVQPRDTNVSAVINAGGGVQVELLDGLNHPLPGQGVAIAIGSNPGGTGTLSGTLVRATDSLGTATFPDLKLDWFGQGYTLVASANPTSGAVTGASIPFSALRVGEACLGPSDSPNPRPVCRDPRDPQYCADSDGDGLHDAWETSGGVDVNGDGAITDARHDLLLPGADPGKPDVYVYYDWMDYGREDAACSLDSECTRKGAYHAGETCNRAAQCVFACSVDSDCTSRTPATASHAGERCISNVCEHTHDPLALEPNAFQPVIDRFAAHGINLHVLRGRARPHSQVISIRSDAQMDTSCEGASLSAGTAGVGKYAVSFYDLKSTPDTFGVAHHYALFGHHAGCDSSAHCPANPGNASRCPNTTMTFGQSGLAELSGNDLIVSLGHLINNVGLSPHFEISAVFMHELGHNLGMSHDGRKDEPCALDAGSCAADETCTDTGDGQGLACHLGADGVLVREESNHKPNYLSVMNYTYVRNGIPMASVVGGRTQARCSVDAECGADGGFCLPTAAGTLPSCSATGYVCRQDSDCTLPGESCLPVPSGYCARLDYSAQALPAGGPTPGVLDESSLDDTLGLGSGTADMFRYTDALCHVCPRLAPTTGPVNWGGDGVVTDPACNLYHVGPEVFANPSVQSDVDSTNGTCAFAPADLLHGHVDWPDVGGLPFVYKFQCNPRGGN